MNLEKLLNTAQTSTYQPEIIEVHSVKGSSKKTIESFGPAENVEQYVLNTYDALHYWFSEKDTDDKTDELPTSPVAKLAANYAAIIKEYKDVVNLLVDPNQQPVWTDVRNKAMFISGSIGDPKVFAQYLDKHLGGTVIIDASGAMDKNQFHSLNDPFIGLMNAVDCSRQVIDDAICERYTTRGALNHLKATPTEWLDTDNLNHGVDPVSGAAYQKWFLESKWLTNHLITEVPVFAKNWRTLIITGLTRYIHSGDFNVSRLYHYMTQLGRVNTRLVFVG